MPYDMPMSLEEALADPEARRRALEYLGQPQESAPVPETAPSPEAQPSPPAAPAPVDDLVQRYLAAQGADRQQMRLNNLGQGFGNAAETALGGVGVKYARSPYEKPSAADDVLALERTRAAGAPKPTKALGMTDEQARTLIKERYPAVSDALLGTVTPANFDKVLLDLRADADRTGRASALTRREEMERERLDVMRDEGKLRRSVDWAKLRQQAEEAGASRGFRLYLFEREEEAKDAERADKKATKAEALNVPGFDVAEGATPTLDDAKKLKDTNDAALRMRGTIKDLRTLHQKYGEAPKGTGAELQQQALRAVQIEAKNIAGLGALSGPDFGLMQDLSAQDANSVTEWVRRNFTGASLEDSLQGLERWMNTVVSATAESRGYAPRSPGEPPKTQPKRTPIRDALPPGPDGNPSLDAPEDGMVTMTNPKGKRFKVPIAELYAAEKRGWKRVK